MSGAARRSRKMPGMSRPAVLPPATIDALKAILGPGGWLDAPSDRAPFETDFRGLHHGTTPLVALPDSTARVAGLVGFCARERIASRPAGRQHQLLRGRDAAAGRQRDPAFAAPPAEHPRGRPAQRFPHGGGGLRARRTAVPGRRRADRLLPMSLGSEGSATLGGIVSTNAGGTSRAALRHDARARARPRGGAARRARARSAVRPAQGQHGLRPEAAVHRRGGHARDRDGRDAAGCFRAPRPWRPPSSRSNRRPPR